MAVPLPLGGGGAALRARPHRCLLRRCLLIGSGSNLPSRPRSADALLSSSLLGCIRLMRCRLFLLLPPAAAPLGPRLALLCAGWEPPLLRLRVLVSRHSCRRHLSLPPGSLPPLGRMLIRRLCLLRTLARRRLVRRLLLPRFPELLGRQLLPAAACCCLCCGRCTILLWLCAASLLLTGLRAALCTFWLWLCSCCRASGVCTTGVSCGGRLWLLLVFRWGSRCPGARWGLCYFVPLLSLLLAPHTIEAGVADPPVASLWVAVPAAPAGGAAAALQAKPLRWLHRCLGGCACTCLLRLLRLPSAAILLLLCLLPRRRLRLLRQRPRRW